MAQVFAAGVLLFLILFFIGAYVLLMMSIESGFKDFDDDKCENCERKEFCEQYTKETGTKYCEDYENQHLA